MSSDPSHKFIAYALFSLVEDAVGVLTVFGVRNCSLARRNVGQVLIRIGTPGPIITAINPVPQTTEWSRSPENCLPILTCQSAAFVQAVIQQSNDTTWQVDFFDAGGNASGGSAWFGLYTLVV